MDGKKKYYFGWFNEKRNRLLSDFDKSDTELFTTFCGFCWEIESITPLVFDFNA